MGKSDEQIIETLIEDTIKGKLNWYKKDQDTFYTTIRKIQTSKDFQSPSTMVDIIFQLRIDEFQNEYEEPDTIIYLDILLRKNKRDSVKIKSMHNPQLSLIELIGSVMKLVKQPPRKNG